MLTPGRNIVFRLLCVELFIQMAPVAMALLLGWHQSTGILITGLFAIILYSGVIYIFWFHPRAVASLIFEQIDENHLENSNRLAPLVQTILVALGLHSLSVFSFSCIRLWKGWAFNFSSEDYVLPDDTALLGAYCLMLGFLLIRIQSSFSHFLVAKHENQ